MATGQKAAIVTGAASGLGRAMALGLAGNGIDVVAVDRDAPALATLQAPSGGGSVMPLPADLAQPDVFERIPAVAVKEFGRIDVLVNNAGIGQASVRADQRRNPIRFWEVHARAVEPLPRRECHRADHDGARGGAAHAARKCGPDRHRDHQPRHDGPRGLSALWLEQGGGRIGDGGAGRGSAGHRRHRQRAGARRCDQHAAGRRGRRDRGKMLQPEIMVPPLLWLVSDAAAASTPAASSPRTGTRSLPPAQAAEKAGAPIAWLGIARMPIEPT